jgi:alpha-D-ribose 1-methylphosphonate 5-phosphate C-P lyase
MQQREAAMIELTDQQIHALQHPEATPPRIVNPRTKETFVLLRADEYQRLKENEYDDSPWTREELHALAWEAGKHVGWEEMDAYDDLEKP